MNLTSHSGNEGTRTKDSGNEGAKNELVKHKIIRKLNIVDIDALFEFIWQ